MTSTGASARAIPSALSGPRYAVLALGAAGSLAIMFWTGRHQQSIVLMALFAAWVAAPFAALALAGRIGKAWPTPVRRRLDHMAIAIGLGSLVAYGGNVLVPFSPTPAAIFLVLPAVTWVVCAIGLVAATVRSRA